MPKIQCFVQPNSGIAYHRLVNPFAYIDMGEGWEKELLWFQKDEHCIACDILIYSKYLFTEPRWLKKIQEKGTKIIVDVDDSWDLPPAHPNYKQWIQGGYDKLVAKNIQQADLVICTTMKLQDKVRTLNSNTVVIPNAFPYGQDVYQPLSPTIPRTKMNFIYAGGSTHLNDVRLLEGKFRRIGTDKWIQDRAEFLLAGYEKLEKNLYKTKEDWEKKNENYEVVQVKTEWDHMANIFRYTGSYGIVPSFNLDDYINVYDLADVALIPLVQTEWNSYKSPLKVLEAACKKIPVICSQTAPYYPELQDCPGIMWVQKPDDWLQHIKCCIKNPEWVKEQGQLMADYIWEQYSMEKWNAIRKQVITSLL